MNKIVLLSLVLLTSACVNQTDNSAVTASPIFYSNNTALTVSVAENIVKFNFDSIVSKTTLTEHFFPLYSTGRDYSYNTDPRPLNNFSQVMFTVKVPFVGVQEEWLESGGKVYKKVCLDSPDQCKNVRYDDAPTFSFLVDATGVVYSASAK